jgi:hypothetical protein
MTQINLSKGAMAAIAACIVGTAGSVAWFNFHKVPAVKVSVEIDPNSTTQPIPGKIPQTKPSISVDLPLKDNKVDIYRAEPTQNGFKMVPKNLPLQEPTKSPEENLRAAFGELLAGGKSATKGSQDATPIPAGTQLLSLKIEPDGVHIDLSSQFTSGGGATSMQSRLAEILYTATSFDPNANVWLSIEGKKLEVLGGEGIEVPQPLTRKIFKEEFESQQ